MKIKNIQGVTNNIPSIGSFSVDQIIEIDFHNYEKLNEKSVLSAIANGTHVFLNSNDEEFTQQESCDLWFSGRQSWVVIDKLIDNPDSIVWDLIK